MLYLRPSGRQNRQGGIHTMATKNQCIHCSVESCQHHETNDVCAQTDIKVAPRANCCNGKCDESECASYKTRR